MNPEEEGEGDGHSKCITECTDELVQKIHFDFISFHFMKINYERMKELKIEIETKINLKMLVFI